MFKPKVRRQREQVALTLKGVLITMLARLLDRLMKSVN